MNGRRVLSVLLLLAAVVGLLIWYGASEKAVSARPIGQRIEIPTPLGLPPVPYPADNPPTAETVALGRRLYYDTSLSADNTVSCATCHNPHVGAGGAMRGVSVGTEICPSCHHW